MRGAVGVGEAVLAVRVGDGVRPTVIGIWWRSNWWLPGEHVVDVLATPAARVPVSGSTRLQKNDPNDARSVANAVPRQPGARPRSRVRNQSHSPNRPGRPRTPQLGSTPDGDDKTCQICWVWRKHGSCGFQSRLGLTPAHVRDRGPAVFSYPSQGCPGLPSTCGVSVARARGWTVRAFQQP